MTVRIRKVGNETITIVDAAVRSKTAGILRARVRLVQNGTHVLKQSFIRVTSDGSMLFTQRAQLSKGMANVFQTFGKRFKKVTSANFTIISHKHSGSIRGSINGKGIVPIRVVNETAKPNILKFQNGTPIPVETDRPLEADLKRLANKISRILKKVFSADKQSGCNCGCRNSAKPVSVSANRRCLEACLLTCGIAAATIGLIIACAVLIFPFSAFCLFLIGPLGICPLACIRNC
ncbi:hypothetical protein [Paenibacillus sp.]|uniref:hypothetical protein n=1 Tax=Paenibacillus sp. TaxID=58172 RepID=UPI002821C83E|nr:hypothetical protein [Paenibacillus sp.]MDR0268775.1 hypothetical protein [Paenibacillus sp.]